MSQWLCGTGSMCAGAAERSVPGRHVAMPRLECRQGSGLCMCIRCSPLVIGEMGGDELWGIGETMGVVVTSR